MTELARRLEPFGAHPDSLYEFDVESPALLPYAALLTARANAHPVLSVVDAVYEWQNEPLMFLINADRLGSDKDRLSRIRRLLAMRGDAPYVGVAAPGRLDVYRLGLDRASPTESRVDLAIPAGQRFTTFVYLANQRPATPGNRRWIFDVVLNLLTSTIDELEPDAGADNAISLVGRALFTRFLADRGLLPRSRFPEPADAFENARQTRATSAWLDDTFNGDFLQLTRNAIQRLPGRAFKLLSDVLHRAPGGQLFLGWRERWDHLDFAHIPVGVLSQAYEHYLRQREPARQRREGGYYTPRPIADLVVRTAFAGLAGKQSVHEARVLDAAAGAGVFLLTAFRELVAARWHHDRVRPVTQTLRKILYEQITGFDTNEAALRFAALGLYLISIELDPSPEPVRKLRFKDLRGTVLQKVGNGDGLGSLGKAIGKDHEGRYDIVLGNPPWTTGGRLESWSTVKSNVVRIARNRLGDNTITPPLPNECLDLPFLWRAMEWTKPGGQIALALHGRLLFQQGDGMPEARRALFRALDVTAIINGAELRGTKVWPSILAPFCLLFATNTRPAPGAGFRFLSPRLEASLNDSGAMRIDPSNAQRITSKEVVDSPQVLKLLFRGTQADLQIWERLRSRDLPTFEEYWTRIFGRSGRRLRCAGNGYQLLRRSSPIGSDRQPGVSADDLAGLPEFRADAAEGMKINVARLDAFPAGQRLHRKRDRSIFRGPLLIVHKSPLAATARIEAWVADRDVVFNETYYGYSAREHPRGVELVRYLALLLSSKIALWLALITSGEFGFERDVVEKATIDKLILPRFEQLTEADSARVAQLFETGFSDTEWDEIDSFVAAQYGLHASEIQIIKDTLRFNLPFAENKSKAQLPPDQTIVEEFCDVLSEELKPWVQRFARPTLRAIPDRRIAFSPWRILRLSFLDGQGANSSGTADWSAILQAADEMSAAEVLCSNAAEQSLWIGRLNQARYWSPTQARLVAQRVIWDHISLLTEHG
jgi:N-6 DNA Methylase